MKNAKCTWKNYHQSGVPTRDCWSSREWRRYEERQKRRTAKHNSDPNPEQFNDGVSLLLILSLVGLGVAIILLSRIIGWPIALIVAIAAVIRTTAGGD